MKYLIISLIVTISLLGCGPSTTNTVQSLSGAKMATTGSIQTNTNGHTIEQQNIADRIQADNKVGAIKHLYLISSVSGQTLLYSTVKGKVTSSGKRLTPADMIPYVTDGSTMSVEVNGKYYLTNTMPNEDGTYGSSAEYIYWWDAKGVYHQQYTQGAIIHISDQPLTIKGAIINMESVK